AAFFDPNAPARINAGGGYLFGTMTRTEGWQRMRAFESEDFNLLKNIRFTDKVTSVLQVNFINAFNRHIFNPVTQPMFNRAAFFDPNAPARINAGGGYLFGTMTRTEGWQRMRAFESEDFNLLKNI